MRFIFPDLTYEKLGGAENMIYEIILSAHKNYNIESILIGSDKSFVIKRLSEDGIPFKFIDQRSEIKYHDNASDLFIHFHNYDGFHKLKKLQGRSILWGILAPQLTGWNRFGIEKKITGKKVVGDYYTRKMLLHLHSNHGLISMDGATSDAVDIFCDANLDLPIIPIPVNVKDARFAKNICKQRNHTLRISYIGRSDACWKIMPVKKIVKDFSAQKSGKFEINIYTDQSQPYIDKLKGIAGTNVTINFHIGFYGPRIRDHISMNSDLHFSMGTAAIEGALSGIPTILIDPCASDFPENYRYKWLYETERCSLGRFINSSEDSFAGLSITEIIACLNNTNQYFYTAERCLEYVKGNHSVENVVRKLIQHPTTATNMDISRYTPATWSISKVI